MASKSPMGLWAFQWENLKISRPFDSQRLRCNFEPGGWPDLEIFHPTVQDFSKGGGFSSKDGSTCMEIAGEFLHIWEQDIPASTVQNQALPFQWPFREPKLEVPTIYKPNFLANFSGISPQNMAKTICYSTLSYWNSHWPYGLPNKMLPRSPVVWWSKHSAAALLSSQPPVEEFCCKGRWENLVATKKYGMLLLVGGCPAPLKNMKVGWDHYSQYMEKIKNVPNH